MGWGGTQTRETNAADEEAIRRKMSTVEDVNSRYIPESQAKLTGFLGGIKATADKAKAERAKAGEDPTTSIAPPDTFAPFLREMQRRVTDRALLGGRDRMFAGQSTTPTLGANTKLTPTGNQVPIVPKLGGTPGLGMQGGGLRLGINSNFFKYGKIRGPFG